MKLLAAEIKIMVLSSLGASRLGVEKWVAVQQSGRASINSRMTRKKEDVVVLQTRDLHQAGLYPLGQKDAERFFIVLAHRPVVDLAASACCCSVIMVLSA
jgi:hypothetical protein